MSAAAVYSVTDRVARTTTADCEGAPVNAARYSASTITDDALDALYAERDAWKQRATANQQQRHENYERAKKAEAKLEQLFAVLERTQNKVADFAAENEKAEAELERLRAQQAGHFQQMAAAREQTRRWWQRAQRAERALERVRQWAEGPCPTRPKGFEITGDRASGYVQAMDEIAQLLDGYGPIAALEGQQQEVAP